MQRMTPNALSLGESLEHFTHEARSSSAGAIGSHKIISISIFIIASPTSLPSVTAVGKETVAIEISTRESEPQLVRPSNIQPHAQHVGLLCLHLRSRQPLIHDPPSVECIILLYILSKKYVVAIIRIFLHSHYFVVRRLPRGHHYLTPSAPDVLCPTCTSSLNVPIHFFAYHLLSLPYSTQAFRSNRQRNSKVRSITTVFLHQARASKHNHITHQPSRI
jgi:hypothetical protein